MNELLNQLYTAQEICKQAAPYYERATQLQQEAAAIPSQSKMWKIKWSVIGVLIFGVVYIAVGIVGSVFTLIPAVGDTLAEMIMIAGSIAGIFIACKIAIGKYKAEKKAAEVNMNKLLKRSEAEARAAQEFYDDHAEEMAFLPVDYWYPMAIEYLIKTVKSGRVQSLGEALDKYDAQLHRWKIEEANAQLVAQQEQQTAHLASIRRSSKINAAANVFNAINNFSRDI